MSADRREIRVDDARVEPGAGFDDDVEAKPISRFTVSGDAATRGFARIDFLGDENRLGHRSILSAGILTWAHGRPAAGTNTL